MYPNDNTTDRESIPTTVLSTDNVLAPHDPVSLMFNNTIYALIIVCLKVAEITQATAEMHIDNECVVKEKVQPAVKKNNRGRG